MPVDEAKGALKLSNTHFFTRASIKGIQKNKKIFKDQDNIRNERAATLAYGSSLQTNQRTAHKAQCLNGRCLQIESNLCQCILAQQSLRLQ